MGEVMLWPWPAAPSPHRPAHPARLHPLRNKTPGVLNKSERKALWGLMTVAESEFKCKERKKKNPVGRAECFQAREASRPCPPPPISGAGGTAVGGLPFPRQMATARVGARPILGAAAEPGHWRAGLEGAEGPDMRAGW